MKGISFKNEKQRNTIENIYKDLKEGKESTIKYEGNTIHVVPYTLEGGSPYASEVERHSLDTSEYTIYMGEPCISDELYGIPILFHEIGHIVDGDMTPEKSKSILKDRTLDLFSREEYKAWLYAVSMVGAKLVFNSLKKLSLYSLKYHENDPGPAVELYHYAKLIEKTFSTPIAS